MLGVGQCRRLLHDRRLGGRQLRSGGFQGLVRVGLLAGEVLHGLRRLAGLGLGLEHLRVHGPRRFRRLPAELGLELQLLPLQLRAQLVRRESGLERYVLLVRGGLLERMLPRGLGVVSLHGRGGHGHGGPVLGRDRRGRTLELLDRRRQHGRLAVLARRRTHHIIRQTPTEAAAGRPRRMRRRRRRRRSCSSSSSSSSCCC